MHFWANLGVSIFGIWLLLAILSTGAQQCPHKTYLKKHVCSGPASEASALQCSKQRNSDPGLSKTGVNTVLFGASAYSLAQDNRCVNQAGMTAYTCNLNTNRCRHLGNNCQAKHDPGNGHLFYKEIRC